MYMFEKFCNRDRAKCIANEKYFPQLRKLCEILRSYSRFNASKVLKCKGKPRITATEMPLGSIYTLYTNIPHYCASPRLKPNNPIHKVSVVAVAGTQTKTIARGTRRDEENFSTAPAHTATCID